MKKYEGIMKDIWRIWSKYGEKLAIFANKLYLKEEEAWNFSKSQEYEGNMKKIRLARQGWEGRFAKYKIKGED